MSSIARNFINKIYIFVIVPVFPFPLLARLSAKNCLGTHLEASFTATSLIKHNSCLIDVCRKLQRVFFIYSASERWYGHNPKVRAGSIPPWEKQAINFTTTTSKSASSHVPKVCTQTVILVARILNLISVLPNVNLPLLARIFLIWFRTRVIGNNTKLSKWLLY